MMETETPTVPGGVEQVELVAMMGVGGRGLGGHEVLVLMEEFHSLREIAAGVKDGTVKELLGEEAGGEVEMWWREEWVREGGM